MALAMKDIEKINIELEGYTKNNKKYPPTKQNIVKSKSPKKE